MKATKSIFEKAYLVRAQAEKAAAKEFGADWAESHTLVGVDRKFMIAKIEPIEVATAAPAYEVGGFTHCPHCDIALDNGICMHGDDVNGTPLVHEEFEFACLACGGEFGPAILADLGQAAADRKANASMGTADAKPRISTCEKPTKKVWHIADSMPKASRKDVMAQCVAQGIAYGTARTQYQAWFKASQECMRGDIRMPHQKGE